MSPRCEPGDGLLPLAMESVNDTVWFLGSLVEYTEKEAEGF